MIVHIFTPESREYYNLERLWSDAQTVDLGDAVLKTRVAAVTGHHALYFRAELDRAQFDWMNRYFDGRALCGIEEFVFLK